MSGHSIKRKAKQLNLPALEEDPAERKRILNVLAQRRYRRRRKEHLQGLERTAGTDNLMNTATEQQAQTPIPLTIATSPENPSFDHFTNTHYTDPETGCSYIPLQPEGTSQDFLYPTDLDPATLEVYEASFSFPLPSLPSSPSLSNTTMSPSNASSLTSRSQSLFDENLGMDEVHLPMLELNLLRGAMAIARRLGVDSLIFSLEATSPFHNSTTLTYSHLPPNLRPTLIQVRNAHHPVLDILPWPSVRNKLILIFAQAQDMRPPNARSPTALLDLVYDLEDPTEGVRVCGDDPYADENWEIGEKMFSNWWWALNSQVINRSNEMRRNRGAPLLGLERNVQEIQ